MPPLNWLDICLGLYLLWSAFSGLRAGLARVVVGIVAAVAGLVAGFWCYRLVGAKLAGWVGTEAVANIGGFLLIFCGTLILGSLVGSLLSRLFQWVGLSWFNHFLGGVAGLLRGALVVSALLNVAIAFSPSPIPASVEQSRVLPYASEVSSWLVNLAPRELKDAFTQQLQNLERMWAKPQRERAQNV
jgi:membrane protein required for colicin V production